MLIIGVMVNLELDNIIMMILCVKPLFSIFWCTAQSQESVTDESSPAASQSPASQPPIAGPAGDPEAMAGGGNVDKKLKGNPVGVNTSGVSNGLVPI